MIKKLIEPQGQFTHVEILKLYPNGCIDVDMLKITEQTDQETQEVSEVEQYREKGTSFDEPYPFKLTATDLKKLNPEPVQRDTF